MYYVYILTNWNNKVLYTGISNNLERRVYEHKYKINKGFTAKYNVNKLVYLEYGADVNSAIAREKQIKHMSRKKKEALINALNPQWDNLEYTYMVESNND